MDAKQFLNEIRDDLEQRPDIEGLKAIRAKLDAPDLLPEILDYLVKINHRAEFMNDLIVLGRLADDLNAKRNTQKLIFLGATGAGMAAMLGSFGILVALSTGLFLVPLFVGGAVATHGGIAALDAAEEERLYAQIHGRLENIEKAIEEKLK